LSEQAIVTNCRPQLDHWINIKWFSDGIWRVCIFMASLKKHIDNFKRLAFKGFATYHSESFTHFGGLFWNYFPPHLKTLESVHVTS
jgi:hypothetical protein